MKKQEIQRSPLVWIGFAIILALLGCSLPGVMNEVVDTPAETPRSDNIEFTATPTDDLVGGIILTDTPAPDEEDDENGGSGASSQLHGKWHRIDALVAVDDNVAPFEILGTELEFNENEGWMIESTAAYYLEGETDGWECNLSGQYSATITPNYEDGIVEFLPDASMIPWENNCSYSGSDAAVAVNASVFHVPIIATPNMNFEFNLLDDGATLFIMVTIPSDIGDVSRSYTYERME